VLQSQITVLDALLGEAASCTALNGGGSVLQGAATNTSAIVGFITTTTAASHIFRPTWAKVQAVGQHVGWPPDFPGRDSHVLRSERIHHRHDDAQRDGAGRQHRGECVGTGYFTPVSGARTPVQLGLYCGFLASSATTPQCAGGIAQDFPSLGIAIGAVTPLALTLGSAPPLLTLGTATTGGVTFTGGGSAVTGPPGSLTLTNPNSTSLVIQGARLMPLRQQAQCGDVLFVSTHAHLMDAYRFGARPAIPDFRDGQYDAQSGAEHHSGKHRTNASHGALDHPAQAALLTPTAARR